MAAMSRDDGDVGDSKTRDYPIFCCKGFLRVSAVILVSPCKIDPLLTFI
jgi:hypothetical protein